MILNIFILMLSFLLMEFVAWFSHKYVMHGFMWPFHKDHHFKEKDTVFERNDIFFIIFALPAIILIYIGYGSGNIKNYSIWIGLGITLYGIFYIIVHDIISHQRLKLFTRSNNRYVIALRKAHKIHHKNLGKHNGKNFAFMFEPLLHFRDHK